MFKRLFLNDIFLLIIITLNALIIFIQGFYNTNSKFGELLEILDHFFTLLFTIEVYIKLKIYGIKGYFINSWNIFDFSLVLIAFPSMVILFTNLNLIDLDFLLTLRILRVFKFFRVLKFIPNIDSLLKGLFRAVKSSILILITFLIFNFIFAIISFSFFSDVAPEYFSNPLISFYSTFKIFTVEGWYEIPDLISERTNSLGFEIFTKIYFIILLFGGGIFGLSLINSIFVDNMMSDNNNELLNRLKSLENKLDNLKKEL